MTASVLASQRFTSQSPCPICGGHARLPSGQGVRCYGFLSSDGRYAHCSREEFARGLEIEPDSDTFAHRLSGSCRCGATHGAAQAKPEPATIRRNGADRRIVATYDYPDEAGRLLYQSVRFDPKDFQQRRPDGRGGWIWSLGDARRVPYRLPELLAADPTGWVLIPEGEKDVDRLAGLGFVATTNAMGGGKWRAEYSEALQGRRVVLLPDNDEAGEKHADTVATALHGVAAEVRVLRLPNLPSKGDVSDWLDAGGTREELLRLMDAAPPWKHGGGDDERPLTDDQLRAARLVVQSLTEVSTQPVSWDWYRWLARGKFHLLGGYAGDGKSTVLASLAATGSRGGQWPDGTVAPRVMRTLFLLGEDSAADTLRPRLELHDADLDQIFVIETVLDEAGQERFFNIGKHLDLLEAAIVKHGIDWIVIDPLTTIMPGTDRNAEGDTRDALTPLIKLADRRNVAITGVAHVGKSGDARRAAQKILGATAFHALARAVWMVAPDVDERMVLGVVKSNLAIKPPSLVWSRQEDGPIVWEGVAPRDVEDLLSGTMPSSPRADAEGFLHELLSKGAMASGEVEDRAKAAGIAWRTVRRAADAIDVKKWKEPGTNGRWFWRLPDGQPTTAKHGTDEEVETLDSVDARSLSNGVERGHLHAMTPHSPNGRDRAEVNIMEGGQVVHPELSRGGQVPSDAVGSTGVDRWAHATRQRL